MLVNGAAGAVGHVVGQVAKIKLVNRVFYCLRILFQGSKLLIVAS